MKNFFRKKIKIKTKTKKCSYFFFASLIVSGTIAAQQTYVPDNNFEQALIDLGYDNVLDDYVPTNNINRITTLNVYNRGISDLTGIEGFIGLKNLNCSFNNLKVLNLSSNKALTIIACAFNNLSSLDISAQSSLTFLDCGFNYLNNLDLTKNVTLTALYADYNNLNNLNLKNGGNQNVTTFQALGNPNLACIQVDNIQYSQSNWIQKDAQTGFSTNCSAPVSTGKTYVPDNNFEQALISLGYDNVLDDYVLTSNISGVTSLNVYNKGISDLTGIEGFTGLTTLNCVYNSLTSLDLSNNLKLKVLSCYLNNLTSLDLSNNTALTSLSCSNNKLKNLNLKNGQNPNMVNFDVRNNPDLTCIEVDNVAYSQTNWTNKDAHASFSADCGAPVSTGKTYVPDNNFEQALISLGYDNVLDDYVLTSNISGVTSLNVYNKGISDLTGIEGFTGLTSLNCVYNSLTSLDLSKNLRLKVLSCYLNNLSSLDLSKNTALTSLSCSSNNLKSLNLRNGNNLNITDFRAAKNPDLTCIEVDNPAYSQTNWTNKDAHASFSADCGAPVSTGKTYVPDNNFEQALISLGYDNVLDDYVLTSNISGVTSLNVYNKGISDLTGIEGFTGLTSLNCVYNSLTSLDLSKNLRLKVLSCYLNNLSSLDLSNNTALTSLSCSNNNLESLNLRNGNNLNITSFRAADNPGLTCIEVDNAAYSQTNWTNKDAHASFSEDCQNISVSAKSTQSKSVSTKSTLDVEQLDNIDYKIFPNPVKDILNIKLNNGLKLIQVNLYDSLGKRLLSVNQEKIDVSHLANGIYFIELQTNQGKSVKKIIVQ